jgi:tetratricopeptide (TPR) repeat protein
MNIANVFNDTNRLAEAQAFYGKALAVYQSAFGELHPDTGNTFYNLALFTLKQNQRAEAKAYFQKAHAAYAQCYGATHSETLDAAQRVAAL